MKHVAVPESIKLTFEVISGGAVLCSAVVSYDDEECGPMERDFTIQVERNVPAEDEPDDPWYAIDQDEDVAYASTPFEALAEALEFNLREEELFDSDQELGGSAGDGHDIEPDDLVGEYLAGMQIIHKSRRSATGTLKLDHNNSLIKTVAVGFDGSVSVSQTLATGTMSIREGFEDG